MPIVRGNQRGGKTVDQMTPILRAIHAGEHVLMGFNHKIMLLNFHDQYAKLFLRMKASYRLPDKVWTFPNGARLVLAVITNENDLERLRGQIFQRVFPNDVAPHLTVYLRAIERR